MGNFCLVSYCNMYVLPYAKTYIDAILEQGNKCTLLFWDRDEANGNNDCYDKCEKISFQMKLNPESPKGKKILGYIKATKFINSTLDKENFDGIVFLQTHAAIANHRILHEKYRNRYIVDIRDYTLENVGLYRLLENKVFKEAYSVVISSPAYASFLPKMNYVVAHNYTAFPQNIIDSVRESSLKRGNRAINISFVGTIRFIEMDKKILSLFKNDDRFQINYYGTGADILRKYAEANGINNTEFYDQFPPSMTTDFYKKTDLINNLYGNNDKFLDYALSNKLYHSGQFHLPILVCPETYMEEVVRKYSMGFVLDVNDLQSPNKLYSWFKKFDRWQFSNGCDEFIHEVKDSNEKYLQSIRAFVSTN